MSFPKCTSGKYRVSKLGNFLSEFKSIGLKYFDFNNGAIKSYKLKEGFEWIVTSTYLNLIY